jgi:DNA-binding transcriptional ArsR family regulator
MHTLIFGQMDIRIEQPMTEVTPRRVFEAAAELFALLSTPTRLRIVCELSEGEKNVGELLERVGVSQPNMSQHLGMLYRGGVVARRREGSQVFYCVTSERVLMLCKAVCAERRRLRSRAKRVDPLQ